DPMYKAMASSAKPRHAVQPPFFMPAALDSFGMDLLRDQVVVAQRDPIALADLASRSAGGGPNWRSGCSCVDVFLEDWGEELGEIGLLFEEARLKVRGEGLEDLRGEVLNAFSIMSTSQAEVPHLNEVGQLLRISLHRIFDLSFISYDLDAVAPGLRFSLTGGLGLANSRTVHKGT
ncbi:MAG: hypothetical protein Q9184_002615, partial [Pyrenodesmia sp. 2 TL-2023]